ncbi:MAG: hypothetical protein A2X13_08475 [Bacteroidetes bacterium GWC2_33_15]|nr:MAG: hypothetical protein A2X10_10305 [Bacteroidetes bacterium GWA2_33_15]OFX51487.1 MAG: hypothetical protein A2X13_08475 [Bacteroidetes bacterium GWC2_33_15]OFX65766.1 MAG: hypothetical protein A2X15_13300 [Bacteroidetes bacterium GWB2_32_14]OFX69515.1 MAG: hypothetical protein A2X14_10055 [Bacteroidetes bacterium GWD2_33_33]HAN17775.1 hypothetical protein [Bacteroidales bacterium]
MKTRLITIGILFSAISLSFGQIRPFMPKFYQPIDSSVLSKKEDKNEKKQSLIKNQNRVSYSVSVGAGYNSFSNNLSMMSSYVAPSVNYIAGDRLSFTINGVIMQNNYNGLENFSGYQAGAYNSNTSNYGINGSVLYQISEKWSIYGDGTYFENQSMYNDYNSGMYDNDYKSVSLGVGYKISEKFQFNAQFRYSKGLNPVYNSISPFYQSPFNYNHSGLGIFDY